MKKILFVLILLTVNNTAKASDPVFTVWAVTHIAIMANDAVSTGVDLPPCEKQRQENPSAYALTHGGWGNGTINGPNLKTCKE